MSLGGAIHEYHTPEAFEEFIDRSSLDMNKIRQVFKMASVDRRVKGVILEITKTQDTITKQ